MIEVSSSNVDRVTDMLGGISGGAADALAIAINKGRAVIKSEVSSGITETYAISKADLRTDTTITASTKKSSGSVIGTVTYSGKKLPLYRFGISQKSPSAGTRNVVSARQLKSSSMVDFNHAFITSVKSGHIGLFEVVKPKNPRGRSERLQNAKFTKAGKIGLKYGIKEIYGSSVSEMADNVKVKERAEEAATEVINAEIGNAITKVLEKWGGSL